MLRTFYIVSLLVCAFELSAAGSNSCQNRCDEAGFPCSCDRTCARYGDCCADICEFCPDLRACESSGESARRNERNDSIEPSDSSDSTDSSNLTGEQNSSEPCAGFERIASRFTIEWHTYDKIVIDFRVLADVVGRWVSFGFSTGMDDTSSDVVIGFFEEDGDESVEQYEFDGYATPQQDSSDRGIFHRSLEKTERQTIMEFSRRLTSRTSDKELVLDSPIDVVWAFGEDEEFAYHGSNRGGAVLNLYCSSDDTEKSSPNSGTDTSSVDEDIRCRDDGNWRSSWGGCEEYSVDGENHEFCGGDIGGDGVLAADACPISCRTCEDLCSIEISGRTGTNDFVNGFYQFSGIFNGRPYYLDPLQFVYIYFLTEFGGDWNIGATLGDLSVYGYSVDTDALSPDLVTIEWEIFDGDAFVADDGVSVHCVGDSPTSDSTSDSPGVGCVGFPWQSGSGSGCFVESSMKFWGHDIECFDDTDDTQECCDLCKSENLCDSWTYQKSGSHERRCCLKSDWRPEAELDQDFDSGYPHDVDGELCSTHRDDECTTFSTECIEDGLFGACDNAGNECKCRAYYDCEKRVTPTKFVNDEPNYCVCYAGTFDCPFRTWCDSGVGFSDPPYCVRTFPKIEFTTGEDIPSVGSGGKYCHTVNRFVGYNNAEQFRTNRACDGHCSVVKHGQACTLDSLRDVKESIRLWFEAFTLPALSGGGYVDHSLAELARAQTLDQSCSDFLGWVVMAVVELCRGSDFVNHGLPYQVLNEGHNQEGHGVANMTNVCVIESGNICTEALLAGIELGRIPGSRQPGTDQVSEMLRQIESVCPDGFPFAPSGISSDPMTGVISRIKEAVTMLTPDQDCDPCPSLDQNRICHFNSDGEIISVCQTNEEWLENPSRRDFFPFGYYRGVLYDCDCNPIN